MQPVSLSSVAEVEHYEVCRICVEELALYLKPISGAKGMCVCTSVCIHACQLLMVHFSEFQKVDI